MKKALAAGLLIALCLFAAAAPASASIGVGVGTGRIKIDEPLRSGGIYKLPPVTVFNTGTQEAKYTMSIQLNEKQPQHKPDPKWFTFSPAEFTLKPKQAQRVVPTFRPPVKTVPGDYFAYLEAGPAKTVKQGTTQVGVAAATKLSFKLAPSNLLYGIFYRIQALFNYYKPWTQIALIGATAVAALLILNRFVNLRAAWNAGRGGSKHRYRHRGRY